MPDIAALVLVIICGTAFAAAQGLTYPLIAIVFENAGVPPAIAGLNAGIYSLGLASTTLLVSRLSRVIRPDFLIFVGLAGCAFSLAVFSLTYALWVWFFARFALGFFANLIFIISEAWLHSACPDHIRGRVTGLYGMGISGGFAVGPLVIPFCGASGAFVSLSVYVASVGLALLVLSRRARTRPEHVPPGAFISLFRRAPLLILMVFAFAFSDVAALSTMPTYFMRQGHSENFAAISVTVLAIPMTLSQPFVGILLDKTSPRGVAVSAATVAGLSFLIIPSTDSPTIILVIFGILGAACFALNTCALTVLGKQFTGGALIAGTSAFALAYAAGSAGGSSLTGIAMELAGAHAAPATAGALLLCLALTLATSKLRM
ncbi:MFS transporter [Sinorhizobium meliloti]|uniref:MFS transporter n=1 Tax=Rhizobium meliloti TaxID=382 RepID=UPI000FD236ED|nr:MFS transporter [Sinorhizobium meliloti]RVH15866.1 MFS transporter [Sinorhizobium meliloti]RVK25274.1 MFS transporter [Sinorhizobium meliloti]RVO30048.1 MFS transporter [Sinorhizobium meliloti]RVO86565.1 MFS transporter [Sinorhizobium meliloti]RVQ16665.1 MFS transporter [Sinorhizobium meliloti]